MTFFAPILVNALFTPGDNLNFPIRLAVLSSEPYELMESRMHSRCSMATAERPFENVAMDGIVVVVVARNNKKKQRRRRIRRTFLLLNINSRMVVALI